MKALLAIMFFVVGGVRAEEVAVTLTDGTKVTCARVLRKLPTAIQFVDTTGTTRMVRVVDLSAATAVALKAMPVATPAPVIALPMAEDLQPSVTAKLENVGSKSSTSWSYRASWGSSIRTETAAAIFEARLTLRQPKYLTAEVVTVFGKFVQSGPVELRQNAEVAVRMAEPDRSRTIYDLKALDEYYTTRNGQRARPFVQVVYQGKVLAEAGDLPGHQPGELVIDPEVEKKKARASAGGIGFGTGY